MEVIIMCMCVLCAALGMNQFFIWRRIEKHAKCIAGLGEAGTFLVNKTAQLEARLDGEGE